MKKDILSRIAAIVLGICISVLIITLSIGFPIYFRPFYYAQIKGLGIPEDTGFTVEQIRQAYNELLNYLTIPGREFSVGDFNYSESGVSHFEECKTLFLLNGRALILSALVTVVIVILSRTGVLSLKRSSVLKTIRWAGIANLSAFTLAGLLIATLGFGRAFAYFHLLVFPSNLDWLFDPVTDGIILALPRDFFMRCAIVIILLAVILSALAVIMPSLLDKRKGSNKSRRKS